MRAERKRKKKKVLWIVLSIIGLFVLATGGYAYHLWNTAASTVAGIQENLKKSDKRDKDVDLSKKTRSPFQSWVSMKERMTEAVQIH